MYAPVILWEPNEKINWTSQPGAFSFRTFQFEYLQILSTKLKSEHVLKQRKYFSIRIATYLSNQIHVWYRDSFGEIRLFGESLKGEKRKNRIDLQVKQGVSGNFCLKIYFQCVRHLWDSKQDRYDSTSGL